MAASSLKPFRFAEAGSTVLRKWNEERRLARALAGRAKRDFAGAGINRLTMSLSQSSRSINADLDSALAILRARARSLCANYDYARRFLSLVAANIVGANGPTLQVRKLTTDGKTLDKEANQAIETHWGRWSAVCDLRGLQTLTQMLHVVVKGVARDGEALVRTVRNKDLPYGIALQLLEPDRLDETLNQRLGNGNVVRMGVELDSMLKPVAYWLLTQHPGENYRVHAQQKYDRVPAADLYHVYVNERAEQARGYTWMHAVLLRAAHAQGYEEAAVVAARLGASKVGFFKRNGDPTSDDAIKRMADAVDATTGALQMNAEPGEFIDLPPGYDFTSFDPDYPHQMYADFVRSCLRGFASGTDVDYASLSNDRASENYSSIRHGALESREAWKTGQEWLAARLLRPLFTDWLASGLITGAITWLNSGKPMKPELLSVFADAARFQGRRWDWVDPKNDAEASRLLIEAGLASRTEIAAGQGRDFADIVEELAQEKKLLDAAGLPATFSTAEAKPKPAAPKDDERKVEIHNHQAPVTVNQGATNVTLAEGAVKSEFHAGNSTVNVPEREVKLEASIVNNMPAPQLAHPKKTVETIARDENREISTITREVKE